MNLTNRIHISQYQYLLIILLSTFICGYEDFENQLSQTELILTVISDNLPVVCFRSSTPLQMACSTFFFLNSMSLCSA